MFSSSPAALVGLAFLFAAAPARAHFASIQFSSVSQCGNFSVSFQGGKAPSALPLTLSILPVNGTPTFIPLPLDAWNSSSQRGVAITFLPYPAGTEFVASLDDADGRGTALVSDVLVINPDDDNNTSCIPQNRPPFVPRYSLNASVSQCESFSVDYDTAQDIGSPTIRAFVPKGASFPIPETEANDTTGVDTYLMDVPRNSMALILFQDANGYAETSSFVPILGDINSDTSCIPTNPLATAATLDTMSDKDNSSSQHVTPKIAIIVIIVCVTVVVLVALAMVAWYLFHRRKLRQQSNFSMLADTTSPSPQDPEKLMVPAISTPSPISPTESGYGALQQYVRDPPYINALISPTSPDPKDPFGERAMGSILGPLSARESLNSRLGATAVGNVTNGSSTLALPRSQLASPVFYTSTMRSSTLDPASEPMAGTSPYLGRLAMTPDNSLASHTGSVLRGPIDSFIRQSSVSSGSVTTVEIDRILEMATIYGSSEMPDMPQPVVTAPATLRSSAYMAGRESRRSSYALSLGGSSPVHSRNNSATASAAGSVLSHSTSQTTLRLNRAFREPPLAPLPSSPLPSPGARPSFDSAAAQLPLSSYGLRVPPPPQVALSRTPSSLRQSVYSVDGDEEGGLEGFAMLRPPMGRD